MPIGSRNVALIGFMGTGKTNVGKVLGKKLGRRVIDIDRGIEEKEKRRISEIFEKNGEPHFRKLEKEAIRRAAECEEVVITTGGGAVLDPENLQTLKRTGWVVSLSARPETIYRRVKDSRHRPLLKGGDMLAQIRRLLEVRGPLYAKSDMNFETDGRTSEEVAQAILEALEKCPPT